MSEVGNWFKADATWWQRCVELMTASGEQWHDDAIRQDLRWWHDHIEQGRGKLPGRVALKRRWNATDHKVKCVMKWAECPKRTRRSDRQPAASSPHAGRQPVASPSPAASEEQSAASGEIASSPHADRTSAARPPHVDRLTRVGDRLQTQTTDTDKNNKPTPPPADPQQPSLLAAPCVAPDGAAVEGDTGAQEAVLTDRQRATLNSHGLKTLRDLASKTRPELLALKGVGRGTVAAVEQVLAANGLELKEAPLTENQWSSQVVRLFVDACAAEGMDYKPTHGDIFRQSKAIAQAFPLAQRESLTAAMAAYCRACKRRQTFPDDGVPRMHRFGAELTKWSTTASKARPAARDPTAKGDYMLRLRWKRVCGERKRQGLEEPTWQQFNEDPDRWDSRRTG